MEIFKDAMNCETKNHRHHSNDSQSDLVGAIVFRFKTSTFCKGISIRSISFYVIKGIPGIMLQMIDIIELVYSYLGIIMQLDNKSNSKIV